MKFDLTPEQQKTVDKLVAQGWPRETAEFMVVMTEEDIIEGEPPPEEDEAKPH